MDRNRIGPKNNVCLTLYPNSFWGHTDACRVVVAGKYVMPNPTGCNKKNKKLSSLTAGLLFLNNGQFG